MRALAFIALSSSIAFADAPKKPPAELDELAKPLVGTWRCSGKSLQNGDASTKNAPVSTQFSMQLTFARTLDGRWIQSSGKVMDGNQHGANQSFTGYVAAEGTYYRYSASNDGSYMTQTATMDRAMGGTWGMTWLGDAHAPTRTFKVRNTEKFAAGVFERGAEVSIDSGSTWTKMVEMTCKK